MDNVVPLMPEQQRAKDALNNFAGTLEKLIGSPETVAMLERLTRFMNETPESIQQLRSTVENNAEQFDSLLSKQGVDTITIMIGMSESGEVFDGLF